MTNVILNLLVNNSTMQCINIAILLIVYDSKCHRTIPHYIMIHRHPSLCETITVDPADSRVDNRVRLPTLLVVR